MGRILKKVNELDDFLQYKKKKLLNLTDKDIKENFAVGDAAVITARRDTIKKMHDAKEASNEMKRNETVQQKYHRMSKDGIKDLLKAFKKLNTVMYGPNYINEHREDWNADIRKYVDPALKRFLGETKHEQDQFEFRNFEEESKEE